MSFICGAHADMACAHGVGMATKPQGGAGVAKKDLCRCMRQCQLTEYRPVINGHVMHPQDGLTALQLAKKYHPDSAVVGLLAEAERLASVSESHLLDVLIVVM